MAQQINLYTPILLKPQRHFSARRMAWALGVLAGLLLLACAALQLLQGQRAEAFADLQRRQAAERQQLTEALQRTRLQRDPTTLTQQLRSLQTELPLLRAQWAHQAAQELAPGRHHSDTLALVARSVPAAVWVTRLRLQPDQIEILGKTLDPAALHAWLPLLEAGATPDGQPLAQVRVEAVGARPGGPPSLLAADASPGAVPTWAFRIATPGAADPLSPSTEPPR